MKQLTLMALILAAVAGRPAMATEDSKPDLHVQVKLLNGAAITGIALGGRLVERHVRGLFKESQDSADRRAGIRVYYYRNANGFIFLPYRTIKQVHVLGELTQEQKEALEKVVAAAERQEARTRTSSTPTVGTKPTPGRLSEKERQLLTRFDPSKGWSAKRYGEIQRRRIVLKRQPTELEDEFCTFYLEWEAAYKKLLSANKKPKATKGAGRLTTPKAPRR